MLRTIRFLLFIQCKVYLKMAQILGADERFAAASIFTLALHASQIDSGAATPETGGDDDLEIPWG